MSVYIQTRLAFYRGHLPQEKVYEKAGSVDGGNDDFTGGSVCDGEGRQEARAAAGRSGSGLWDSSTLLSDRGGR